MNMLKNIECRSVLKKAKCVHHQGVKKCHSYDGDNIFMSSFHIDGKVVEYMNIHSWSHLGHILCSDLSDDIENDVCKQPIELTMYYVILEN